jgi:hypothetical protein
VDDEDMDLIPFWEGKVIKWVIHTG